MTSKSYATVDSSQFPIIKVEFSDMSPSVAHIDDFYEKLEAAITATEGRYVTITVYQGKLISSDARVRLGEKARSLFERYKDREIGSIIVSSTPLARMMLQTITTLFHTHSNQQRVVNSWEKALEAARQMLNVDKGNAPKS